MLNFQWDWSWNGHRCLEREGLYQCTEQDVGLCKWPVQRSWSWEGLCIRVKSLCCGESRFCRNPRSKFLFRTATKSAKIQWNRIKSPPASFKGLGGWDHFQLWNSAFLDYRFFLMLKLCWCVHFFSVTEVWSIILFRILWYHKPQLVSEVLCFYNKITSVIGLFSEYSVQIYTSFVN